MNGGDCLYLQRIHKKRGMISGAASKAPEIIPLLRLDRLLYAVRRRAKRQPLGVQDRILGSQQIPAPAA